MPAATPITTILFDLDDTLFDHIGTAWATLAATAAGRATLRGVPVEDLYRRYSELLEELHPQVMTGRISYQEARQQRFARLLAPYEPAVSAEAANEFARQYYGHYQQQRRPVAGALALLKALKPEYKIGVVTNNRLAEQQEKLRHLGMSALVDALVTSEEVGVLKPDARIYQVALARLGSEAAQTVMVGDNWTADVVGALAVGIRPVWLNRTGAVRPLPQVAELTSLEPLADVLQHLH
ncbi:HAD family hydrolase [Hymenobacter setariae]|uniref:HAD family hydrolase n=1 Tax=Hymenobacter setariae TaxID=2594794 RepID=A0A558C1P6_9BACT|nr:HAD family hydrolase [Hymenobacter setariae]TVT42741.1 HAD family hydrolase [Hymenobacter setariae]